MARQELRQPVERAAARSRVEGRPRAARPRPGPPRAPARPRPRRAPDARAAGRPAGDGRPIPRRNGSAIRYSAVTWAPNAAASVSAASRRAVLAGVSSRWTSRSLIAMFASVAIGRLGCRTYSWKASSRLARMLGRRRRPAARRRPGAGPGSSGWVTNTVASPRLSDHGPAQVLLEHRARARSPAARAPARSRA